MCDQDDHKCDHVITSVIIMITHKQGIHYSRITLSCRVSGTLDKKINIIMITTPHLSSQLNNIILARNQTNFNNNNNNRQTNSTPKTKSSKESTTSPPSSPPTSPALSPSSLVSYSPLPVPYSISFAVSWEMASRTFSAARESVRGRLAVLVAVPSHRNSIVVAVVPV